MAWLISLEDIRRQYMLSVREREKRIEEEAVLERAGCSCASGARPGRERRFGLLPKTNREALKISQPPSVQFFQREIVVCFFCFSLLSKCILPGLSTASVPFFQLVFPTACLLLVYLIIIPPAISCVAVPGARPATSRVSCSYFIPIVNSSPGLFARFFRSLCVLVVYSARSNGIRVHPRSLYYRSWLILILCVINRATLLHFNLSMLLPF